MNEYEVMASTWMCMNKVEETDVRIITLSRMFEKLFDDGMKREREGKVSITENDLYRIGGTDTQKR